MPDFAVLDFNVVINKIVADTLETAETITKLTCVEYVTPPLVEIGYIYDPKTNTFSAPVTESSTDTVE